MRGRSLIIAAALVALVALEPTAAQPQYTMPIGTTLQNAAVANGNGNAVTITGMSAAILTVNCATCSGGTTVNFEGSEDGTNFSSVWAVQLGTNTIASSTTTAGVTVWEAPVGGLQQLRARVSGYSAGTVTVTMHAGAASYGPKVINANVVSTVAGTTATSLGKAEDAASASGDTGIAIFGVRNEAGTALTNADADYGAIANDAYGVLYTRQDHPKRFHCVVTVSTATTLQAVGGSCAAPGAGLSLYVTDVFFSASASGIAADAFPTLKYGTGGTCGTGTAVFWQALTAAAIVTQDNRSIPIKIPANNEICWITSTAGSKAIQISGFIAQ